MGAFKDISQHRFGGVVALRVDGKDKTGKTKWECICDCGNIFSTTMLNLCSGNTKSCGCKKFRITRKDISGIRFGRLVVVSYIDISDGVGRWICDCDCGGRCVVKTGKLQSGATQSCGCLSRENSQNQAKKNLSKSGIEHPRWRSDYNDDDREKYRGDDFKKWSRTVKEVNNFTCIRCLSVGGKINSHHILSYSEYNNHRFNPHNGICLCLDCHKEFHSTYGYTGFTIDDNIDFILKYQYGK